MKVDDSELSSQDAQKDEDESSENSERAEDLGRKKVTVMTGEVRRNIFKQSRLLEYAIMAQASEDQKHTLSLS